MTTKSEYLIYLTLGIVLIAFVGISFLLGPIGWIAGAFLLLGAFFLAKWSGLFEDARADPAPSKVNCAACGARVSIKESNCSYCGEKLQTSTSE